VHTIPRQQYTPRARGAARGGRGAHPAATRTKSSSAIAPAVAGALSSSRHTSAAQTGRKQALRARLADRGGHRESTPARAARLQPADRRPLPPPGPAARQSTHARGPDRHHDEATGAVGRRAPAAAVRCTRGGLSQPPQQHPGGCTQRRQAGGAHAGGTERGPPRVVWWVAGRDRYVHQHACGGGDLIVTRSLSPPTLPLLSATEAALQTSKTNKFWNFAFWPESCSWIVAGNR